MLIAAHCTRIKALLHISTRARTGGGYARDAVSSPIARTHTHAHARAHTHTRTHTHTQHTHVTLVFVIFVHVTLVYVIPMFVVLVHVIFVYVIVVTNDDSATVSCCMRLVAPGLA